MIPAEQPSVHDLDGCRFLYNNFVHERYPYRRGATPGKVEAILISPTMDRGAASRRTLRGLAEIVGSWDDVERAQLQLREQLWASLERSAKELDAPGGSLRE